MYIYSMTNTQQATPASAKPLRTIAAILISGLCWYVSNGLNGNFWYLLWVAPIPVLLLAFRSSWKITFIASFIAYLIGRISWFSYLVTVATLIPAIVFSVLTALIFAMIILATRFTVIKTNQWFSLFAFPAFFTSFEFLLINLSPDGTASSIAYSQSDFLPLIQIASVAGILGITFIVCFIPSAISVILFYRHKGRNMRNPVIVSAAILLIVFLFGFIRLNNKTNTTTLDVGLVVLQEKYHNITQQPDLSKEKTATELYANEISMLAQKGAKAVVLPERAINITKDNEADIISILSNTAKQNHVFIVTGYTNFRNDKERNSSLVIDDKGTVITDYNKVHLVTGLEAQFTPGKDPGLFSINQTHAGTAICKDLDFPYYINKYGGSSTNILFIPAWDFIVDDWLHSRMAILRGVENGFSEVRAARQGRLTISDPYGRVNYEATCADGNAASLIGKVYINNPGTFNLHYGNWLGIACCVAAALFIFYSFRNLSRANNS